ncbi:hypothetical protein RYX36_002877 [Vicia faba]
MTFLAKLRGNGTIASKLFENTIVLLGLFENLNNGKGFDMGDDRGFKSEQRLNSVAISSHIEKLEFSFVATQLCL